MDKKLNTFTNITEIGLPRGISLSETQGDIKPALNKRNLILIGTWACALIITTQLTSVNNYDVSTSLNYPNKNTQTKIYEPIIVDEDIFFDEEINSNIFVKTKPERSYRVKLNIKGYITGKPIIDEDNSYDS